MFVTFFYIFAYIEKKCIFAVRILKGKVYRKKNIIINKY